MPRIFSNRSTVYLNRNNPLRYSSALLIIVFSCVAFGCTGPLKKGVTAEGEKVYFGSEPIETTAAYRNFTLSSKTEKAKLYYLLDRIKDSKNLKYWFEGNEYGWFEAYGAGTWILWTHYKKGEGARSFLKREVSRYPDPNQTAYVKFPDGHSHLTYHILLNELDFLEETDNKNGAFDTKSTRAV